MNSATRNLGQQIARAPQTARLLALAWCMVVCCDCMVHEAQAAVTLPPLDAAAAQKISYRGDVWPILKRHCWACHSGPSAKGALRLDSVADMLKGGESGPLFAPGKPDESLLVEAIAGDKPSMPKKQAPLSAAKTTTLRLWILAGAKDDSGPPTAEPTTHIPAAYQFAPAVTSLSLSADGKLLAAACRSEALLVETESEAPARRLPTDCDLLTHVEFSPNGATLAAVGGSPGRFGAVRFFKVADGSVLAQLRIGHDSLFRGAFAPDGQSLAVGGPDGAAHIVPLNPAAEPRRLELHSDWVLDVAFSPDGKLLITGGRDKAIKVASVESGRLIRAIDASTDWISCVTANEQFAVASGRARKLVAYEFKTALEGAEITGGGNDARPVNRRDQYAKPFEDQPDEVLDLATSGDRKLLAVAGAFGEVRVYRLADRTRVATVPQVAAPVYSLAMSADGSRLAVGLKSGVVQIYEIPAAKLLRSFTPAPLATSATAK